MQGSTPNGIDVSSLRTQMGRTLGSGTSRMAPDNSDKPRDWKKLSLVIGLGILSWVATYVGMLELIEANIGELPLVHKAIIAFSVGMLMTMIIWLLDQLFAPIGLFTKTVYALGYVFLSVISVGFGFGFYWKVLESKSEATRGAESAITQVQSSLHGASTRLEQLQSTLIQLTAISTQKAELERTQGTSCPNSRPGDGPRRKLREDDAQRFQFASDFVKGRTAQVKSEIATLDADLVRIVQGDVTTVDAKSGTRNEFMRGIGRKLDMTVTGFNAFRTDPQLKQLRADLAERADKTTFLDTRGQQYACPDPQLSGALKGVVRAIDALPEVEKPKIVAVEGSEATIEAFRRLTATFYGMLAFKLPPSAEELRELQTKAIQSVEPQAQARTLARAAEQPGLSKRDYVPLAVALFVDICLLLVSMGRPTNRLGNLVPRMRAAENGPVSDILSAFKNIHDDQEVRETFEVFRHIVFDFNGDYYAAVPLIAPYRRNARGELVSYSTQNIEQLTQEAHLLSNLFTSFEKEKIFARVYNPLLTTSAIQKRLWRQGSKFAQAESFRLFKFKDGAWSEFILGAIMGADKRIRTEKQLQREAEGALDRDPVLPGFAPPPSMQPKHPAGPNEVAIAQAAHRAVHGESPGAPFNNPTAAPHNWPDIGQPSVHAYPQPTPQFQDMPAAVRGHASATHGGPFTGFIAPDQVFAEIPNVEPHPARARGVQRFQEMTQRATPHGFSDVMPEWSQPTPGFTPPSTAQNNNTHPEMREPQRQAVNATPYYPSVDERAAPFDMQPIPQSNPQAIPRTLPSTSVSANVASLFNSRTAEHHHQNSAQPTIEVEARRETITYRVPISEASLPSALLPQRLAALTGREPQRLHQSAAPAQHAQALALSDETAAQEAHVDIVPIEAEELDAETRRILGKLGPAEPRN